MEGSDAVINELGSLDCVFKPGLLISFFFNSNLVELWLPSIGLLKVFVVAVNAMLCMSFSIRSAFWSCSRIPSISAVRSGFVISRASLVLRLSFRSLCSYSPLKF